MVNVFICGVPHRRHGQHEACVRAPYPSGLRLCGQLLQSWAVHVGRRLQGLNLRRQRVQMHL